MIEFQNVSKGYKDKPVLLNINMKIETGEFIILIDGVSIKKIPDNKLRRSIGYVIQDGGLFPHLTVYENIALLLKITGAPADKIPERIHELLTMVNLEPENYMNCFPCQLSGGQKQRVGVARAFAADPDIILMDEPFSALDPVTRGELQNEIVKLQKYFKKTIVFVTHDMDEAIRLADRVCIIQNGKIAQFDKPEEILKHPANSYVEEFVGKNRLWGNPAYIKASDIMRKGAASISKNRTVLQALQIMKHNVVDSLLVTSGPRKNVYEDTSLQEIIDTIDYNVSGIIPVINHSHELQGYLTKSSLLVTLSKRYRHEDASGMEDR